MTNFVLMVIETIKKRGITVKHSINIPRSELRGMLVLQRNLLYEGSHTPLFTVGVPQHSCEVCDPLPNKRSVIALSNAFLPYYSRTVTIAARRRIYWGLFFSACACLVTFFPLYLQLSRGDISPTFLAKAGALGSFRLGSLHLSSHYLAAGGIGLCSLYSTLVLAYILYSFRKTVSAEIYFFSFWVLSVGLEVVRLVVFDLAAGGGSAYWQIAATKALFFARYAGYLSLFASGLYAAGFRSEKLGTVAALIIAVSLGLATAMPINTGSFEATFELRAGYIELNSIIVFSVAIVTIVDYLYAAHSIGEGSYRFIALGAAVFLIGHHLLITQWNPLAMIAGFVLLVAGSWLYVSRLHSYYLWQ
jgi:hypothetical protein